MEAKYGKEVTEAYHQKNRTLYSLGFYPTVGILAGLSLYFLRDNILRSTTNISFDSKTKEQDFKKEHPTARLLSSEIYFSHSLFPTSDDESHRLVPRYHSEMYIGPYSKGIYMTAFAAVGGAIAAYRVYRYWIKSIIIKINSLNNNHESDEKNGL